MGNIAEMGPSASDLDAAAQPLHLAVWDYGGQRVFYDLHHLFLTRLACYVVVFNMEKLQPGPPRQMQ